MQLDDDEAAGEGEEEVEEVGQPIPVQVGHRPGDTKRVYERQHARANGDGDDGDDEFDAADDESNQPTTPAKAIRCSTK